MKIQGLKTHAPYAIMILAYSTLIASYGLCLADEMDEDYDLKEQHVPSNKEPSVLDPASVQAPQHHPPLRPSGFIEFGSHYLQRFAQAQVRYQADIKFKTPRIAAFRGHFRTNAHEDNARFRLREVYITHGTPESTKFELGLSKKRLGRETEYGELERGLVRSSLIYRRLELLGYTGHQPQLRYLSGGSRGPFLHVAMGYPGSQDINTIINFGNKSTEGFSYAHGLLIEQDKREHSSKPVWASLLSIWWQDPSRDLMLTWENLYGIDSIKSDVSSLFGRNDPIYMLGHKFEWLWDLDVTHGSRSKLVGSTSGLLQDVSATDLGQYELTMGWQQWWHATRLAFSMSYVSTKESSLSTRHGRQSQMDLMATHFF